MTKNNHLKKTAYHEAGHAVAHHFLHLPFKHVTINKGETSLGHLLSSSYPKSFRPDIDNENYKIRIRIEKEIMASFAGHAAELKFSQQKNWKGARHDNHTATGLALHYCESTNQAGAFLDWLWIRTVEWLGNPLYWMCVEIVANELLNKRTLKTREVRRIIREAMNDKFNKKV